MQRQHVFFKLYFFVFLFFNVFADTNINGLISSNTTLTLSNSPYIVTDNILVSEGTTLIIEPGVTIKFDNSKSLQINGTLIARGTSAKAISFTTSNPFPGEIDWGNIYFTKLSQSAEYSNDSTYLKGSILEYVGIEYATTAILVDSCSPCLYWCFIRNCKNGIKGTSSKPLKIHHASITKCGPKTDSSSGIGIYIHGPLIVTNSGIGFNSNMGIYHEFDSLVVSNSGIENNNGDGIRHVSLGLSHRVLADTFYLNLIENNKGDGLNINADYDSTAYFGNNNIQYNDGVGINCSVKWAHRATINTNIIANNKNGGITVKNSDSTSIIEKNMIINNEKIGISAIGGSAKIINNVVVLNDNGVYDSTTSGTTLIQKNSIFDNKSYAIRVIKNANIAFNAIRGNNISDSSTSQTIYLKNGIQMINNNNIIGRRKTINVFNDNPSNAPFINGKNNWWGTTNDQSIDSSIYDWYDDATKNIFEYKPFLTQLDTCAPILPPTGFTKTAVNGGVQLTWIANSEPDVAGYKIYSGYHLRDKVDVGNVTSYLFVGASLSDPTITITAYDKYADGNFDMSEGHESWFQNCNGLISISGIFENPQNLYFLRAIKPFFKNISKNKKMISFKVQKESVVDITLYNLFGKELRKFIYGRYNAGYYSFELDMQAIADGIYLLKTNFDDSQYLTKVIKIR